MGKRKAWTEQQWADELEYIRSVNPTHPGRSFNNLPPTFSRYCFEQAGFAREDGFPETAERIIDRGILALEEVLRRRWEGLPEVTT